MEETWKKICEYGALYGMNILAALAIFIVGRWITMAICRVLEKVMDNQKVDKTLSVFLKNLIYYTLLTFVFVAVLGRLGIQTASFVAVVGAAGLALGLALQGSLANFAAGVLIILFRPFSVGDVISAGGVTGKVREIDIFDTVITSPESIRVTVPNSQIMGGIIQNYSANPERLVVAKVGIAYEDDIKKARKVLIEALSGDSRILKQPAPVVVVVELGNSSVNLAVKAWVHLENYDAVMADILEKIKETLDQNSITIPYPQQVVRMMPSTAS